MLMLIEVTAAKLIVIFCRWLIRVMIVNKKWIWISVVVVYHGDV